MSDLLNVYTELFVMPEDDTLPYFACSVCDRNVSDEPCPDHAPLTPPPGLRLVDCVATERHLIYVINRDDYGFPCPECQLMPYFEDEAKARQCRHWAWRRTKVWRRLVSTMYVLGVIPGSASSWGNGHDWCVTVGGLYGRRPYILGVPRETWRCWLKGHRRGEEVGFGFCGKCVPWTCCGSTVEAHADGCGEAVNGR